MGSKKAIFWPVIISIFIHVTLLAVTGMIDLRDNIRLVEDVLGWPLYLRRDMQNLMMAR